MSVTEKQGYIGDLHSKSLPELRELLQRQENLLKKQKFLESLPDKGSKVKKFAETLRKLIEKQEDISAVTSRLDSVAFEESAPELCSLQKNHETSVSANTCTRSENSSVGEYKGNNSRQFQKVVDTSDRLIEGLERVTISSDQMKGLPHSQTDSTYTNSYERVVKRASERAICKKNFKPNSSLKISKVQELPEVFKLRSRKDVPCETCVSEKSMDTDAGSSTETRLKSKVVEESAVCIPDYKHNESVLISVEESLQLVEQQRRKHEELQTRQAAQRLADRLHIQLEDYNPEGTDMQYRVAAPDTDSDDEPEIGGYEDD